MPLMPAYNYVLTQKVEEKKTVGSLIIPDSSKNKQVKAVIIATNGSTDYEKDDVIYYEKLRDRELIDDEGNTFYLVHEDHILAKII